MNTREYSHTFFSLAYPAYFLSLQHQISPSHISTLLQITTHPDNYQFHLGNREPFIGLIWSILAIHSEVHHSILVILKWADLASWGVAEMPTGMPTGGDTHQVCVATVGKLAMEETHTIQCSLLASGHVLLQPAHNHNKTNTVWCLPSKLIQEGASPNPQ